ncbi:50S ribosomal protein L22 [Candidatus Woesearchaeota archaeon]|nr:50S ribosomal protein L22 [Candidatus Woesearchaeota archaeon]
MNKTKSKKKFEIKVRNPAHLAIARALNLPVSTKHCIEICNFLRYKKTDLAKSLLKEVIAEKRAVPYKIFNDNVGHKPGMMSGRFPQKAAREVLKLVLSVEANAQSKGLDINNLKITQILANRAPIPFTGGRHRTATKRTHLEIQVWEISSKSSDKKEKSVNKKTKSTEAKTETVKETLKETPKEAAKETMHSDHDHLAHDHVAHDHMAHAHQEKSTPAKFAEEKIHLTKTAAKTATVDSSTLLQQAQKKAAELNQKVKDNKDVGQVEDLYEQLQKKGSLR